ncbi:MAG TPA: hypothetical protein VJB96_05000 [Patescibacteria group bacterium]|nr:hypothetical protein [Patescibacteria group bacterium]
MKVLTLAITLLAAGIMFGAIIGAPSPEPAGDICEYYGITQTLITHQSLDLQPSDVTSLTKQLGQPYYTLWYCYFSGRNTLRYPLHFAAYSLLATPIRLVLEAIRIDPLKTFAVTNFLFLIGGLLYLLRRFPLTTIQQLALIALTLTSPLLSFLAWPGPDLAVLMLLLIALMLFLHNNFAAAMILTAIASWQSQPILAVLGGMIAYVILNKKNFRFVFVPIGLGMIPYIYTMYAFGTLTPWTQLTDGWTKLNGFGLHNISLQKLFEQFTDPNIGVFWYAPILTILGLWTLRKKYWLIGMLLATLLAFQTNPAWHYGTSGYGPSRHAIVMIPFFIAIITHEITKPKLWFVAIGLIIVFQIAILSVNNYIFPIFTNTLTHSPTAQFILSRWPALYNPTPEIFVDRTNHTDLDYPTSAIYRIDGICKKTYVLLRDLDRIIEECGPMQLTTRPSIINPETDGFYGTYQ